jgi:ankyrin repeat protein
MIIIETGTVSLPIAIGTKENLSRSPLDLHRRPYSTPIDRELRQGRSRDWKYLRQCSIDSGRLGHETVVSALLEGGAKPDITNNPGNTALTLTTKWGYEAIVRLLLAKGVSPDAASNSSNTPWILAAMGSHEAIVALLLANGAKPNTTNNEGSTALVLATRLGHEEVVYLLLENVASPISRIIFAIPH